jgi:hypothetical protein
LTVNANLTAAVEALRKNPRLLRIFRRRPYRALASFRLKAEDIDAIREGTLVGLIGRGMDPKVALQKPLSRHFFASLIAKHSAKLAPAAFATIMFALWPASMVSAAPREGRQRAARALIRADARQSLRRRAALRRLERAGARRAVRRLGILRRDSSMRRAIRRVGGDTDVD